MKISSLDSTWNDLLYEETDKQYFKDLMIFLKREDKSHTIYPVENDRFNAFNTTALNKIKIVILGQDPYHGENQAHGLAFSVKRGIASPPSLRNILKEYCTDLGLEIPLSTNLTHWADEGVFLLNTVLSVRKSHANSHKNMGWEIFTDAVIKMISDAKEHVVFILWGKPAQSKAQLIDENKHLVLRAPHPSPLSSYRGFFGSRPFTKANTYLKEHGIKVIDWKLDR